MQVYQEICEPLLNNKSTRLNSVITDHILQNIYGFEYLMAPYCISKLRLSEYLKEVSNTAIDSNTNIPVYLTNTIGEQTEPLQTDLEYVVAGEIIKEGQKAREIKQDKEIIVILGNPPYYGNSTNKSKYITELMQAYKPNDEIKEHNLKWTLNNDYAKFIRFAEDKIANAQNGIVGVITSRSFLDSRTFRKMRQHLATTFDKIVIIDLHGNSGGKTPTGEDDKPVFAIKEGVAISFFVKNSKLKPQQKGVYYAEIWGSAKQKLQQVAEIDLENYNLQKLKPKTPLCLFVPQKENEPLKEEFFNMLDIRDDIFIKSNVGICTKRNDVAYQNTPEQLKKVLNDFRKLDENAIKQKYKTENKKESRDRKTIYAKQNIQAYVIKDEFIKCVTYKPFVEKYTYHTNKSKGFLSDPCYDIMQHMYEPNIGLVFSRHKHNYDYNFFNNLFVTKHLCNNHLIQDSYLAPLYLYTQVGNCVKNGIVDEEFVVKNKQGEILYLYTQVGNCVKNGIVDEEFVVKNKQGEIESIFTLHSINGSDAVYRRPNFNTKFLQMVNNKFSNVEPEQIIGYIVAVLHSPTYRTKYIDLLKYYFPRISFDVDVAEFNRLSQIGNQLINAYLMNFSELDLKIDINIGECKVLDNDMSKVSFAFSKVKYNTELQRLYFNDYNYFDKVSSDVYNFVIGNQKALESCIKLIAGDNNKSLDDYQSYIKQVIQCVYAIVRLQQNLV